MTDRTVNAIEARRQFSRLLREVEDGGRVTIAKNGHPVAVLVPASTERRRVSVSVSKRFKTLSDKGLAIGFAGCIDRDELHRR